MKMKSLFPALALLASLSSGFSQVLYTNDFEIDDTANWIVSQGGGTDSAADFFFDYGTQLGIPSAPHSSNGSTHGLRFLCNQSAGVFQGISASPIDKGFVGNFRLRFDMWLNYNGPLGPTTVGGSGSTQCGSAGVGVNGDTAQWAGGSAGTMQGVMFAVTGDGGSGDDYRCYSNATHMAAASGVYVANSRNNTATYYATNFGGASAPAAQATLYPQQTGTTQAGAIGFAWRDVVIEKNGGTVTWTIDGKLIATCATPASFSTNIFFGMFDINGTSSSDVNDLLIASIFDNIQVEALSPSTVSVTASVPTAAEGGSSGEFTFSREGDSSSTVTVNYTMSGSATNGVDYVSLPGSITLNAGETSKTLAISATDDSIAELSETAVLTITSSPNYGTGTASATVSILDNEAPELSISTVASNMYERLPDDYITFRITRKGDLNTALTANVSYSGTAASGRYTSPTTVSVDSLAATADFNVNPVNDSLQNGDQTIIATVTAGTGYSVGAEASSSGTIVDDEYGTETPLFSDSLNSDTSANWTQRFAANNALEDFTLNPAYNLGDDGVPNAPNGSATALKTTVNKNDGSASGAAGINLYPTGQSFSGDFALRFDMFLMQNSGVGTTEFALCGINHSAARTNWILQSTAVNPAGLSDGIWFAIGADASGSAPGDYAAISTNGTTGLPLVLKTTTALSQALNFKKPPYSSGSGAGSPGNLPTSSTKSWADVEIKQIGNVVTLSINKIAVVSYTNTTSFTSGDIMLGYMDPYDSIGSAGGAAYYSNVRVVNLNTAPPTIAISHSGGSVTLTWTGTATLQQASALTGSPTDWSDVVATSPYTTSTTGAAKFYRLKQ